MRRFVVLGFMGLVGLTVSALPAYASNGTPTRQHPTNWQDRDTATYVVSTLNLLHTSGGRPVTQATHAASYVVMADTVRSGLYFIDLHDRSNAIVGSFAYQMGWQKPQPLVRLHVGSRLHLASQSMIQAYHQDPKRVLGVFTSTFPV